MNVMMLLEMASGAFPDRPAFTDGERGLTYTYSELFEAARLRAGSIRAQGASRMAKLDVSNLGTPLGLFASAWAGVPYVPLNYRLTNEEIEALLKRVTPAYLVTSSDRVDAFGALDDVHAVATDAFLDAAQHAAPVDGEWAMDPDEVAVLLFTSGTTGEPKAAVLRHKHLVSYILSSVEFASAPEEDASLVCVPPYHIAGIAAIMSSVYSGRHVIQLPNFSAERWIELARQHKVTTAFVVPTMLARIVETLEAQGATNADMPDLNSLAYGGGKMPLSVIEKAMTLFPETDFSNAYGLTETSSTICVLGPEAHRDAVASTTEAGVVWSPWVRLCPGWRLKFAMTKGVFSMLASVAKFTFVVNRSLANTKVRAPSWMWTVGSLRGTPAAWTTRDSCFWRDGRTMSSCAAARIYRPVKSRTFCSPILQWQMLR